MKIRTDFVTNSSSSCFCAITVTTKEGNQFHWEDECFQDGLAFDLREIASGDWAGIETVSDLIALLKRQINIEDFQENTCKDFLEFVQSQDSLEQFVSMELSSNKYMSDQGCSWQERFIGQQMIYQVDTGECSIINEASAEFIDQIKCMYT